MSHALPMNSDASATARLQSILAVAARAGLFLHVAFLPISIAGMQIGLGIAGLSLFALRLSGRKVWARTELDLPILGLIGAAILSQILAFSWVGGNDAFLWRTLLAPLIIVSVLQLDPERARADALRLLALWALVAILPSIVGWVQHYRAFDLLHELGLRKKAVIADAPRYPGRYAATGFFTWYQRLAHNLTPPLCLLAAVVCYGDRPRARRWIGAGLALFVASVVFLTFSRTSWYGLAGAAFVLAVFAGKRLAPALLAIGAVAAVAIVSLNPGVRSRVETSFDGTVNQDRVGIWNTCAAVVRDHPITGVGFGNLPKVVGPYFDEVAPRTVIRAWCHNTFFTAYTEGGALLLGAMLFFWGWLAWSFWRLRRGADRLGRAACIGGLAALTAMLANAMAHDFFYASESMYGFGFLLALAIVLARSKERAQAGAA